MTFIISNKIGDSAILKFYGDKLSLKGGGEIAIELDKLLKNSTKKERDSFKWLLRTLNKLSNSKGWDLVVY